MYVRFPLSLRNVEDLLFERGIDVCHETVRFWWNRFGPLFAADIRRQRVSRMKGFRHWRWHLDEVYVKLGGEMHYLWRAVDHEGEVLESYVTKSRDKKAALTFMKKALKRHGQAEAIVTDSGGVQKEAYFAGRPCITVRDRTEWTETVEAGWNLIVGSDPRAIASAMTEFRPDGDRPPLFGDGHAAERVVEALFKARGSTP